MMKPEVGGSGGKTARERARALTAQFTDRVARALEVAGQAAEQQARHTTVYQRRSGKLARSIRLRTGGTSFTLRAGARHARFVHNGTRAHIIRAAQGERLAFRVAGQWAFAREVRHPGTAPRPFLRDAVASGGRLFERLFRQGAPFGS